MKAIIIADTHFGLSNASSFFLALQEEYFNRLFTYMRENNIKTLIHLGDVFDNRKAIDIKSLKSCMEWFVHPLCNDGIETYILVGNHDTAYKNSIQPSIVQELLYGTPFSIVSRPTTFKKGNTSCLLVPWIAPENEQECITAIKNSKEDVCMGHFHINGMNLLLQTARDGIEKELFAKFKHVFSGHFHLYNTKENITYIGTPFQQNWSDYGHRKRTMVFDFETCTFDYLKDVVPSVYAKIQDWESVKDIDQYRGKIVKCYINKDTNAYQFDKWFSELSQVAFKVSVVEDVDTKQVIGDLQDGLKDSLQLLFDYTDSLYENLPEQKRNAIKSLLTTVYRGVQHD